MPPPFPTALSQALVPLAYTFIAIGINVLAYVVYELSLRLLRLYRSPLRELPGPPSLSWVFGSVEGIIEADAERLFDKWAQQYGRTFKYSSFFNVGYVFTWRSLKDAD